MAKKPAEQNKEKVQPKILRIGVIQAGKIIEERLIRRRENVTIGASARNTIVVPASTLPRSYTLFEIQSGIYSLLFSEDMDGRVSVDNQVMSLSQAKEKELAQQKGKPRKGKHSLFKLVLNENARGKVLLGEITLLFQFVAPPPIQPRPQLPPSVRGSFFDKMDWTLATSFSVLASINLACLLYLRSIDIPRNLAPDIIPDGFAEYLPKVEEPKTADVGTLTKVGEKKIKKVAEKKAPQASEKKSADAGGGKKAPVCDESCQEERAAARRARLAQTVSRMGALALLGTRGQSGGSATRDLLSAGDPGTEAAKAFRGVGGLTTSGRGAGSGLGGKGGGGVGKSVGIGSLGGHVGGPSEVGTGGMVKERVPKAVTTQGKTEIEGTMNENAVNTTIRRGKAAITSCYQRALKRSPQLSGKLSIRISINAMGRVTRVEIEADSIGDSQVATCIKTYVQGWRFPPPEDGPAEIVVPFVFQAAN